MIFLTVSMYVLLCSAPLVYGIGLKNLVKSPPNVKTVCLSAAKSFVSALCSITVMWFITDALLAPYSLAFLFPFIALALTAGFSIAANRIIRRFFNIHVGEFDVSFLTGILALAEGFNLQYALIIGLAATLSFYLLIPVIRAIRTRLFMSSYSENYNDYAMLFVTAALILCAFYAFNFSWLYVH